jgi:tetratricopeptide (TPR) repeat protein
MLLRNGICALLVCCASSAGVAHADDARAEAREHFVKGTKSFDLGLYDEAIAEYMAAYKVKPDPALLFNLAQAHRLAGHVADALRFYRMYLTKTPTAPNRSDVEARISDLEKVVDEQKKREQERSATLTAETTTSGTASERKPLYKRWWIWTAAGGVVAVGLGVGLGVALAPGPSAPTVNVTSGTFRY